MKIVLVGEKIMELTKMYGCIEEPEGIYKLSLERVSLLLCEGYVLSHQERDCDSE
jgi:hypothetical protein